MRKITWIVLGVILLLIIVFNFYRDYRKGLQDDTQACTTLKPEQAAEAVIRDILRPNNHQFAQYHLAEKDIKIDWRDIQIGPQSALVPFYLSPHPDLRYFGMPRCSVLSDVEYGNG